MMIANSQQPTANSQQPTANSQQPTANSHKRLLTCAAALLCISAVSPVLAQDDPQPLDTITVNGMPFYFPGWLGGLTGPPPPSYLPEAATISDDDIGWTHQSACTYLANHKPEGCSLSNFPAVPGLPSASGAIFGGNGCGAGPMSSAFASYLLDEAIPFYSGNLNRPVDGNESVDFTKICSAHDGCYSGAGPNKNFCDQDFRRKLNNFCSGSTDATKCGIFASAYYEAVHRFANGAWESDQADLKCSSWGNAMKKNGCNQ